MSEFLTTEQKSRLVSVLELVFGGRHNIPDLCVTPFTVSTSTPSQSLATFDHDRLTRLVFACHDLAVRAEIRSSKGGQVRIVLWPRKLGTDGPSHETHPTLAQAFDRWRARTSYRVVSGEPPEGSAP